MNIERLSESGKPSRRYDSPTRRAHAEETRRAIAAAARELFLERGWGGTRVRDVAALAGVSEPSVYAVYRNKAGLAMALLDSLDDSADPMRLLRELDELKGDPAGQLRALLSFDRRLFEHSADAITVIREAGRSKPELADVVVQGRLRGDRNRRRIFRTWPDGTLRDDLGVDGARDVYAALSNVDVYLVLTRERGWSPERVEEWWAETMARLILR
ncbi:MAG TPA: helix-turn-helix domain-containing protein [Nocardioides sp.]|nr:helix-turn-helix domain-containing protein [Nocardioides sp.]